MSWKEKMQLKRAMLESSSAPPPTLTPFSLAQVPSSVAHTEALNLEPGVANCNQRAATAAPQAAQPPEAPPHKAQDPSPPPVAVTGMAAPPPKLVDPNKLHAALLRAKLLGDAAKVALLEAQLQAASSVPPAAPPALAEVGPKRARLETSSSSSSSHLPASAASAGPVVISTLDARGVPIASLQGPKLGLTRDDMRGGCRAGKVSGGAPNLFSAEGERVAYFAEDAAAARGGGGGAALGSAAIAEEAARVRSVAASLAAGDAAEGEDLSSCIARNIGRNKRYREGGRDLSGLGEAELDDGELAAAMVQGRHSGLTERERQSRDMARAVAQHVEGERVMARCPLCLEGGTLARERVVSRGRYFSLLVPPTGQRFPGHLVLAPNSHTVSARALEEEEYAELNDFKAALHRYYTSIGEGVVFLETAILPGSAKRRATAAAHAVLHVVSMEAELALDAPLFFRKAMQEAEEWTTNQALIDTAGKGLRRCIPLGFSYFHVSWAGGGFLHPIEETSEFPPDFGLDVACGMLGEGPVGFGRKEAKRTLKEEEAIALEIRAAFSPFDPTTA